MKPRLLLEKLQKVIEIIENIIKKKSLSIRKKLQSRVDLLFFATKIVFLGQIFLLHLYNSQPKGKKVYISLNILKITCFHRKNLSPNRIVLYY